MPDTTPFSPTKKQRETVALLSSFGIPQEAICEEIVNPATGEPIDGKTLRKHFRAEVKLGKSRTVAKVARALVKGALKGNIVAQIFYLKTQGGWKETSVVENKGGVPVIVKLDKTDSAL